MHGKINFANNSFLLKNTRKAYKLIIIITYSFINNYNQKLTILHKKSNLFKKVCFF